MPLHVGARPGALAAPAQAAKRSRVLIYGMNYAPEPTGVGRYTGELGSYLSAQGIAVEVVTTAPHYPGWQMRDGYRNVYAVEKDDGLRVTRCPVFLREKMTGFWRMLAPLSFALTSAPVAIWRILTTRPDTVLCVEPTLLSAPVALLLAKLAGARTVLHVQDLEIDAAFAVGHLGGGFLQRMAKWFERVSLPAFDAVVTISQHMRDALKNKGIAENRLSVVRNWVDFDKLKPLDCPSSFRRELGIDGDVFVALYAGNVGAKQGLSVLLDAAEMLSTERRLVVLIAGDGPEKPRLVARYGGLPNVRFLGTQPENRLRDLLCLADVHVLPQLRGAADLVLPSKLGGMLASGKPSIVMADEGTELHDILVGSAVLLPPGDSAGLAGAIVGMMRDPGAAPRLNGHKIGPAAELDVQRNLPLFHAILLPRKAGRTQTAAAATPSVNGSKTSQSV